VVVLVGVGGSQLKSSLGPAELDQREGIKRKINRAATCRNDDKGERGWRGLMLRILELLWRRGERGTDIAKSWQRKARYRRKGAMKKRSVE